MNSSLDIAWADLWLYKPAPSCWKRSTRWPAQWSWTSLKVLLFLVSTWWRHTTSIQAAYLFLQVLQLKLCTASWTRAQKASIVLKTQLNGSKSHFSSTLSPHGASYPLPSICFSNLVRSPMYIANTAQYPNVFVLVITISLTALRPIRFETPYLPEFLSHPSFSAMILPCTHTSGSLRFAPQLRIGEVCSPSNLGPSTRTWW